MPRATRTWRTVPVAIVLASLTSATWPLVLAGGAGEPDDEHRLAEQLCRTADPSTVLLGMSALQDLTVPVVQARPEWASVPLVEALVTWYVALGISVDPETATSLADGAAQLDPLVAAPVSLLTMSLAEATRLHALATRDLTSADLEVLRADVARSRAGNEPASPIEDARVREASARVDRALQVAAALLLLDGAKLAQPLFDAASAAKAWPVTPAVADPVGLVRVGSTGADFDTRDRYLLVDPGGNDEYRGRVGGGSLLEDPTIVVVGSPVGLAVELGGDDTYSGTNRQAALGGGSIGVGVFLESSGADDYQWAQGSTAGGGNRGVGVFVDLEGDDRHRNAGLSNGYGKFGMGVGIETTGSDEYVPHPWEIGDLLLGFGTSDPSSHGTWCDLSGQDSYLTARRSRGYAFDPGTRAWFVDLGASLDAYGVFGSGQHPSTNTAYWTLGFSGGLGHGLDA